MELNELRRIAEAATPGPWTAETHGTYTDDKYHAVYSVESGDHSVISQLGCGCCDVGLEVSKPDAAFVTTFNPETVLALLSRVEKVERSCRLLGTIIERDGKNLVELTNSQDIIPEDGDGDWEVVWERAQEMKARLDQAEQAVQRVRAKHAKRVLVYPNGAEEHYCSAEENSAWPCDTIRALEGDGRG